MISEELKATISKSNEQGKWLFLKQPQKSKAEEKWGNGVVEQVSLDLQNEFPNVKGFSAHNLWNMKKWYSFYTSYDHVGEAFRALEKQIDTAA